MAKLRKRIQKSATRTFTDREEFQESFFKAVTQFKNQKFQDRKGKVLNFYGVGGIGKSSLQKELIRKTQNDSQLLSSRVDLGNGDYRSVAKITLELSYHLKKEFGVNFSHFDLAYSIYFSRKNPDFSYKDNQFPYLKEIGFLGSLIGAVDGLGILGAAKGIVETAYKQFQKYKLKPDAKVELKQLENLTLEDIEESLPMFFSFDLELHCEIEKSIPTLFFDTYEVLWARKYLYNSTPDNHIFQLIKELPFCIVVVCGREKLTWSKNQVFSFDLEQHLIGNLSEIDTTTFLHNCNVTDERIIKRIFKASSGHPFHIDLSLDLYFELIKNGITPTEEAFSPVNDHILERLLQHLDENEIVILKCLSILQTYDEDCFNYVTSKFLGNSFADYFHHIQRFSFIIKDANSYRLHDLMKSNLSDSLSDANRIKLNEIAASYYLSILEGTDSSFSHQYIEQALTNWIYHTSNISLHKLPEIIISCLQSLQLKGCTSYLIQSIDQLSKFVSISPKVKHMQIDMFHLQGKYELAVNLIDDLIQQCKTDNVELIKLKIRSIHHKMFFLPISPLIENALSLKNSIDQNRHRELYFENLFMIGGNLGVLHGDYDKARMHLWQTLRWSKQEFNYKLFCRSLRKYIDILRQKGKIQIAEKLCEHGVQIASEKGLDRYRIYLILTKADILRERGKTGNSIEIAEEALSLSASFEIQGWIGHCYLLLTELNLSIGNYVDAKKYIQNASRIYDSINQFWGQIQVGILSIRFRDILQVNTPNVKELLKKSQELNYGYEINTLKQLDVNKKVDYYRYIFL